MRRINDWVEDYLPQATETPGNGAPIVRLGSRERAVKRTTERLLDGRLGASLENWEMQRKIRRFRRQAQTDGGSVMFTPDCCKGHFDHHDEIIMQLFQERLAKHGLAWKIAYG